MFGSWLLKFRMMRAYVKRDFTVVIKYANKFMAKNDRDVGVLWVLADCLRQQGNTDEAIVCGEKAISIDHDHIDSLQLLTELYFYQKNYQSAYKYACEAVAVAVKTDLMLAPYVCKVKEKLESTEIVSIPGRSFANLINNEQDKSTKWIAWAIEFIAWYEQEQKR